MEDLQIDLQQAKEIIFFLLAFCALAGDLLRTRQCLLGLVIGTLFGIV